MQQTPLTVAKPASDPVYMLPGRYMLKADGTWGGALTLTYCETATGTFAPMGTGVTLSADGSTGFECGRGFIKATIASPAGTVNWSTGRIRGVA